MITLELTEEDIATLIDALGTWMELPEECEGEEWLRRQALGADLDLELRESFNRRDDPFGCVDDRVDSSAEAGEEVQETSRAATRRQEALVDLSIFNDPIDW
jgi:hypothetical protein|tara:strand:- start:280 stop:585 length:306 start_codon:yes stop_codon:yes gene_type:complete